MNPVFNTISGRSRVRIATTAHSKWPKRNPMNAHGLAASVTDTDTNTALTNIEVVPIHF